LFLKKIYKSLKLIPTKALHFQAFILPEGVEDEEEEDEEEDEEEEDEGLCCFMSFLR
jgi:hypothetical protein